MEELLARIVDQTIANYMKEALSCYMSGAYRGCIILSYLALFDDISKKLSEVAKINSKAQEIYKKVKERQDGQEVYETFLVDQLKSNKIISELEASTLNLIKERRNKAAHPSGHNPSAEEARFVFSEVINKFLSRPTLTTTELAEEILTRIGNTNFFPSTNIDDIESIVSNEIENIHQSAFPYLINKIVEITATAKGDKKNNAFYFLNGLARKNDDSINDVLVKYYIDKKIDDNNYSKNIFSIISSNPLLFEKLKSNSKQRLKKIINDQIENIPIGLPVTRLSHPNIFFRSLSNCFDSQRLIKELPAQIKTYIEHFPYSSILPSIVSEDENLRAIYINELLKRAASSQFNTANSFIENIVNIEEDLTKIIDGEEALEIILSIIRSAEHGAFSSIDMRNEKFKSIKKIKAKTNDFLKESQQQAKGIIQEKLGPSYNVTKFKKAFL